jgi:hypothetical protein
LAERYKPEDQDARSDGSQGTQKGVLQFLKSDCSRRHRLPRQSQAEPISSVPISPLRCRRPPDGRRRKVACVPLSSQFIGAVRARSYGLFVWESFRRSPSSSTGRPHIPGDCTFDITTTEQIRSLQLATDSRSCG